MTYQTLYDSLNVSNQYLLKVFSVFYEGIYGAGEFASFLSKMKIKDENDKAFNSNTGAINCEMLIKKGIFVNIQYQGGIQFKDDKFKEFLTQKTSQEPDFKEIIDKIKSEYPTGVANRWYYDNTYAERKARDFRIAIYSNDVKYIADIQKNTPDEFFDQLFVQAHHYLKARKAA